MHQRPKRTQRRKRRGANILKDLENIEKQKESDVDFTKELSHVDDLSTIDNVEPVYSEETPSEKRKKKFKYRGSLLQRMKGLNKVKKVEQKNEAIIVDDVTPKSISDNNPFKKFDESDKTAEEEKNKVKLRRRSSLSNRMRKFKIKKMIDENKFVKKEPEINSKPPHKKLENTPSTGVQTSSNTLSSRLRKKRNRVSLSARMQGLASLQSQINQHDNKPRSKEEGDVSKIKPANSNSLSSRMQRLKRRRIVSEESAETAVKKESTIEKKPEVKASPPRRSNKRKSLLDRMRAIERFSDPTPKEEKVNERPLESNKKQIISEKIEPKIKIQKGNIEEVKKEPEKETTQKKKNYRGSLASRMRSLRKKLPSEKTHEKKVEEKPPEESNEKNDIPPKIKKEQPMRKFRGSLASRMKSIRESGTKTRKTEIATSQPNTNVQQQQQPPTEIVKDEKDTEKRTGKRANRYRGSLRDRMKRIGAGMKLPKEQPQQENKKQIPKRPQRGIVRGQKNQSESKKKPLNSRKEKKKVILSGEELKKKAIQDISNFEKKVGLLVIIEDTNTLMNNLIKKTF